MMMMMSAGLTTHQPIRVICVKNGELTWFCSETIIMISHKCVKCKTRTNLKTKLKQLYFAKNIVFEKHKYVINRYIFK